MDTESFKQERADLESLRKKVENLWSFAGEMTHRGTDHVINDRLTESDHEHFFDYIDEVLNPILSEIHHRLAELKN